MDPDRPLFELRRVTQARGGTTILRDVTLVLPRTPATALVGRSGSGKTSLLRLLNRLDDPVSGEVWFDGRPIDAAPVPALRLRIGFVFQTPALFPGTIDDNLRVAASLAGRGEGPPPDPARLLEAVGLPGQGGRDAAVLSGGERQRASIARALMTRPEVLLLDEPTSALDPDSAAHLLGTIGRLTREGLFVVMVTHRAADVAALATHAVVLEAGRVIAQGPASARLAVDRASP